MPRFREHLTLHLPPHDSHSRGGKIKGEKKKKKKKIKIFDRGSQNRVRSNYQKHGVREMYSRNSTFLVVWFLTL